MSNILTFPQPQPVVDLAEDGECFVTLPSGEKVSLGKGERVAAPSDPSIEFGFTDDGHMHVAINGEEIARTIFVRDSRHFAGGYHEMKATKKGYRVREIEPEEPAFCRGSIEIKRRGRVIGYCG